MDIVFGAAKPVAYFYRMDFVYGAPQPVATAWEASLATVDNFSRRGLGKVLRPRLPDDPHDAALRQHHRARGPMVIDGCLTACTARPALRAPPDPSSLASPTASWPAASPAL